MIFEFNDKDPAPLDKDDRVVMAHGDGGALAQKLIEKVFLPTFGNGSLLKRHDSSVVPGSGSRMAFATDSYVVKPLFFPGGDIGKLAVTGAVNKLAMSGADPLFLSVGFILEEGLPLETLWRVVQSMRLAAREAGVSIVAGDTKVVDHGNADGLYLNTTGLGAIWHELDICPAHIQPGDAILLSGDIGRHGIAVVAAREKWEPEEKLESDCASVHRPILRLIKEGLQVHCLKDLARGGLTMALNNISRIGSHPLLVDENLVPVGTGVHSACQILDVDPMDVVNEGRFLVFLPAEQAPRALALLHLYEVSREAVAIGMVVEGEGPEVRLRTASGTFEKLGMRDNAAFHRVC